METIKKEHFEALFGIEADIEVVTLNPFEAFNLLHKEGKISDRDYQTIMDRFNTALINEFNSFSGLTSQQQFEISRATNELNRLSPQLEQLKQDAENKAKELGALQFKAASHEKTSLTISLKREIGELEKKITPLQTQVDNIKDYVDGYNNTPVWAIGLKKFSAKYTES